MQFSRHLLLPRARVLFFTFLHEKRLPNTEKNGMYLQTRVISGVSERGGLANFYLYSLVLLYVYHRGCTECLLYNESSLLETLKGLKKRENVHVPRQYLKLDCCDSPFESPKKKIIFWNWNVTMVPFVNLLF